MEVKYPGPKIEKYVFGDIFLVREEKKISTSTYIVSRTSGEKFSINKKKFLILWHLIRAKDNALDVDDLRESINRVLEEEKPISVEYINHSLLPDIRKILKKINPNMGIRLFLESGVYKNKVMLDKK